MYEVNICNETSQSVTLKVVYISRQLEFEVIIKKMRESNYRRHYTR